MVSSITTDQVSQIDEAGPSWMTPIMHYLSSGELPGNRVEAHKVQVQVARFPWRTGNYTSGLQTGRILSVSPLSRDNIY